MDMITQELDQWLNSLPARHPVAWEQLPDIGLYMDQVLTYVDRQLGLFRQTGQEHVLTPAMIGESAFSTWASTPHGTSLKRSHCLAK